MTRLVYSSHPLGRTVFLSHRNSCCCPNHQLKLCCYHTNHFVYCHITFHTVGHVLLVHVVPSRFPVLFYNHKPNRCSFVVMCIACVFKHECPKHQSIFTFVAFQSCICIERSFTILPRIPGPLLRFQKVFSFVLHPDIDHIFDEEIYFHGFSCSVYPSVPYLDASYEDSLWFLKIPEKGNQGSH